MPNNKQKLELTWIGKDQQPKLEPRILIEDPEKSYGDKNTGNMLIHGDNLLALKALEQEYAGKVKCIYIDPPYNTGSAFAQYDDGVEHSIWLSLIRDRIKVLWHLLRKDGAIFVQIDDTEGHYLKVMMDEIFGRKNFYTSFIWQKVDSPNDNKVAVTPDHEFILCYAKDTDCCNFRQKEDPSVLDAYSNRDADGRLFRDRLLKKNGKNSLREDRPSMFFPIKAPNGIDILPIHDDGREARWALGKIAVDNLIKSKELIWKDRGTVSDPKWIPYTRKYAPEKPVRPYSTIWTDVLTSRQAKAHQKEFLPPGMEPFATPKTEQLLQRILEISTSPHDLVLDSFLGSGTTAAVAHKMGRRWIGIELGEHCHTHCIPRLKKVCDGTDQGGISKSVDWKGGGGFRYYYLAPSLLKKDGHDNWIIDKSYNPDMLAAAMAKHEGFKYSPDIEIYWKQGQSTEKDFIFTTTQFVTVEHLDKINDEMMPGESLLICCRSFSKACESHMAISP